MKHAVRPLALCLLALLPLFARPSQATTFQHIEDAALTDQAPAVIRARVADTEPSTLAGRPATDYIVEVERVLKGDVPGSTLVVRVPGGVRPGGMGLKIWGAPRMAPGESTLLFLKPAEDGTFRILHLMLGAFHRRTFQGSFLALRDLSEAQEVRADGVGPAQDEVRDFDRFSDWIADRGAGIEREPDYLVRDTGGPRPAIDAFTLLRWDDGNPIRWFDFDLGRTISWRVHSGGQPGLGLDATVAAFNVGLQTWTNDGATNIRYVYAGTTSASTGFENPDGVNAILFEDPGDGASAGSFDCGSGGVIAVGGPWFDEGTTLYKGTPFHPSGEADIVTNDGTSCFFQNNSSVAEEVFTHELGHTLGLGHSRTRESIMWPSAHNDGRGARLHGDDLAAIASLYTAGGGGPTGPAAPTELVAKSVAATTVTLGWKDNATDETSFRLERKIGNGSFSAIQTLAANTVETAVNALTPGTTYSFRVRASNTSGNSGYSNVVQVQTPATSTLAAPTGLAALVRSGNEAHLTWSDKSTGETGFRIERSAAGGAFQEIGSTAANTTGAFVRGLTPGTAYQFRVRAAGTNSTFSPYSNTAAATTTTAEPQLCATSGPAVCLNSDRFLVEVDWRTGTTSGHGTLARQSGESATVWFFDPTNVELIVKVLDGRPVNNAFWVFSGALTNVEYWIKITDLITGEVRVWHNRSGQMRSLADTQAFVETGAPATDSVLPNRELTGAAPVPAVTLSNETPGGSCVDSATALCLAGRFRVEARFKNGGTETAAGAIPDSSNTGFVWYFTASNIEMVVKVLDGRPLNGKFWVFYGALSNVESWVRVTDTQTGLVREYHNLPGNLGTLADTSAF